MLRVELSSFIPYGFLVILKYYITYSISIFYCMTNFQVCNAMHNRGRVFFFGNFCLHILLFISFCLSLILVYLIFFFKTREMCFKRSVLYVLEYHVSYNKRVLNERKSEQVHQLHASLFLDNAIHIAW